VFPPSPFLTDAIIRVGNGRGFLIDTSTGVLVITAAHCVTKTEAGAEFPPACAASQPRDRTYPDLLGPIGGALMAWAECLFIDPVADLAVLCEPDKHTFPGQTDAYTYLVADRPTLGLARPPRKMFTAWALALQGVWTRCTARSYTPHSLSVDGPIAGAMSGSPVVTDEGRALAVIGVAVDWPNEVPEHRGQPLLASCLPGWVLAAWRERG